MASTDLRNDRYNLTACIVENSRRNLAPNAVLRDIMILRTFFGLVEVNLESREQESISVDIYAITSVEWSSSWRDCDNSDRFMCRFYWRIQSNRVQAISW